MFVRTCSGFWGLLDSDGYVLNWNGQRSPVVHQVNKIIGKYIQLPVVVIVIIIIAVIVIVVVIICDDMVLLYLQ